MEMLVALISSALCWSKRYYYMGVQQVTQLNSFGFQANGSFQFDIITSEPTFLTIFLATAHEIHNRIYQDLHTRVCFKNSTYLARHNRTFRRARTSFSWSGTVDTQDVYWPYIVDCAANPSNYFATTVHFTNRDYLIDFRDEFCLPMLLIVSFIHVILTFVWLTNSCRHHNFMIGLHSLCLLSSAGRAICAGFAAQDWENEKIGHLPGTTYGIVKAIFVAIDQFLLVGVPLLAVSGWSIYRETCDLKYYGSILGGVFFVVLGLYGSFPLDDSELAEVWLLILLVGCLWCMRTLIAAVAFLTKLIAHLDTGDSRLALRINLAVLYGQALAVLALVVGGSCMTVWAFEFWMIIALGIFEGGLILNALLLMDFFLLREKYQGREGDGEMHDVQVVALEQPGAAHIVVLESGEQN
jgi:hypothetical protein